MMILRVTLTAAILALAASTIAGSPAAAGNCDHSYQNDKSGHSCGDRAADRRSGGKN